LCYFRAGELHRISEAVYLTSIRVNFKKVDCFLDQLMHFQGHMYNQLKYKTEEKYLYIFKN
jgi:hypothetical protein